MKTLRMLLTRRHLLLALLLGSMLSLSGCVGVDGGYGPRYSTGYRGGYSTYGDGYYGDSYYGGRYANQGQYVVRDGRRYSRPARVYAGRPSYRQGRGYRADRSSSFRRNGEVRPRGENRGRGDNRRTQRQVQ